MTRAADYGHKDVVSALRAVGVHQGDVLFSTLEHRDARHTTGGS